MYNLDKVSVKVGQNTLLQNIDLYFEQGAITTILGANGAGKSTLFKTLLGEHKPQTGQVKYAQQSLSAYNTKDLSLKRAYIAQHNSAMFNLLTFDYLLLARIQHNESDAYSQNLVLDVAKRFAITELLMRDISELSGGELQLIEYTRAYLQLFSQHNEGFKSKCLLLDEPASALDIKQTRILYQHLQDFSNAGGTVIIIDHNINAVSALASHVVLLKAGKVLASGPKSEVFTTDNLDACFDTRGNMISNSQSANKVYHLDSASAGS